MTDAKVIFIKTGFTIPVESVYETYIRSGKRREWTKVELNISEEALQESIDYIEENYNVR